MSLRDEVRRRLQSLDMSQAELSRWSGVPEETITRGLRGQRPWNEVTILKMERELGRLPRDPKSEPVEVGEG